MSVNPFGYKKMSSRIYFQGTLEDAVQVDKYSPNRVYEQGQLCTTLIEYYEKGSKITQYIKMRCIADETTGDWKGQAERTEVGTVWTVEDFHAVRKGLTINTVIFTRTLTLTGTASELVRFPLITNLELNPGTYYFSGTKGQSATTFHFEYDDYNSLESTTFTLNSSTKKTFYLVVEPNHSYVLTIIKPRLWTYTGNDWEYEWNPYDWEKVKGVSGYNVKKQYKKGNEAIHNYKLYKCNTDTPKTGELFNPEHWDPVMQSTKEWMDHVDICYGNANTKYKAMYLKTNACLGKYSMTNGTTTKNGLTIDIQNRGAKIVLNGTPTADITLDICYTTLNNKHVYYMSGLSSNGKNTQYFKWGDFKSYEKSTKAWPKSGRDENELFQLVIKKQSPKSSGKPTYENYEINPEMNDTACYDSNCNGIIWKRWSTGPFDVEDVEMKPVSRSYIFWNGQNFSYNYGRWYTLYEMFGWGDSYGAVASSYMSGYTSDSLPMTTFSTGSHQVLLASYAVGYRGIFISQNGVDWLRVHDTQSTGSGWGGRRLANGTWFWLQAIPGPGEGFFMATYSSVTMNPGFGYKYIVTYVHLSYDSNESDFTIEVFNKILKIYQSEPIVVPGLEFIKPIGNMSSTFFFSVDKTYYSFSHVGELNDGKPIISLNQFGISAYLYRDGTMIYPEEGTFEHALWVHEYGKETHSIWNTMEYHLNIAETLCIGCFNGVLVFNIITYSQFSTVRYWEDPITHSEHSERYGDSYLSHLIVKFTGNGSYTISDSTSFDFNAITEDVKTSSSANNPILQTYYYGGKRYFIYGGCNYVNSGLEKDFKVYTTSDGEHFELLSSPGPDASWSAFKNTHDSAMSGAWGFPNLSHITVKAWGDNNSTIDRNAYSASLAIFSEKEGSYAYDNYIYNLVPYDYGRFIGERSTTILAGSFYAGIDVKWAETKPVTEASYRGATITAMIRFTGPEMSSAAEFSL